MQATSHDLPPMWDGRRVEWEGWMLDDIRICPPPKPEPCRSCGSHEMAIINVAKVYPLPGEMFDAPVTKHTRSGREYFASEMASVPAWPLLQLTAFRCPACHADTVIDKGRRVGGPAAAWDLDASDYGDKGSTA